MTDRWYSWRNIWDKDFGRVPFTTNKFWEMQLTFWPRKLLGLDIDLYTWDGQCHAGPSIEVTLLGFELRVAIYDHRHWDYEKDCWE